MGKEGEKMIYPDIGFTDEYQQLFKDTEFGGIPEQFTCAGIDYRFYKRPIPGTPYFDIVSPYGYSGNLLIDDQYPYVTDYFVEFNFYCFGNNIVTEFARLHPFINHRIENKDYLHYEHDIYYIDLTQSEEDIWKGFDKGCKSAIKQQSKNYWLNFYGEDLNGWYPYFEKSPNYKFGKPFLSKVLELPNSNLITVKNPIETISGAIFLTYGDYCHYFLAAGGNQNYLLWEAIKRAKSQGCKIFNLGGGLKVGDSLESFKKSFTKTSKPFYTYRKIHNVEVYNKLCEAKGIDPNTEGYFPAYRR